MIVPRTNLVGPIPVCWPLSFVTETVTSDRVSAACYRGVENFRVMPIVVAELKFRDIEWQIFGADLVERADNTALEDRPKAIDCAGMNRADDVATLLMVDRTAPKFSQSVVHIAFVGCEQADLVGYHFPHEAVNIVLGHPIKHASDDVALAADRPNNRGLARTFATAPAAAFIPVAIVILAADPGFINFNNTHKLAKSLVLQSSTDAVAHIPSRLVGAETHIAMNLPRADSFLAGQHQVNDLEPVAQIDVCVLENRANKVREPISAAFPAVGALPFPFHGFERIDPITTTAGAMDALGPAITDQESVTGIFVREHGFKLTDGHLNDLAGLFRSGHDDSPYRQEAD
jgi:hypothetical protein